MLFSLRLALTTLVIVFIHINANEAAVSDKFVKCCEDEFVVNEDIKKCVPSHLDNGTYNKILQASGLTFDIEHNRYLTCFKGINSTSYIGNPTNDSLFIHDCLDLSTNNSIVHLNCSTIFQNDKCDSIFKFVYIYGASKLLVVNIIYILMYLLVCFIYAIKPKICRRAYDKAVLFYVIWQIFISSVIIFAGSHILCHKPLSNLTNSLIGIMLMILTISTCLWLLIISFNVASTITRISWMPSYGAKKDDENHKFKVYLLWVIIGTAIPVTISTILEFAPLPKDHILKPQFWRMTSVNYRVVAHIATIPILIGIASNILFIYTTWKMISINRSTKLANINRKKKVRSSYILYLKLYLFMDANYVTGALGAIFENLWFLNFVRLIQPVFMLIAVLPREITSNIISRKK